MQTDSVVQRGWTKSQNRTPEKGREGGRRRDNCRQETGAEGAGAPPSTVVASEEQRRGWGARRCVCEDFYYLRCDYDICVHTAPGGCAVM